MLRPLTWQDLVFAPLLMVVPITGFSVWAIWTTVALWEPSFPAWWAGLLAGFLAAVGSGALCLFALRDFGEPLEVVECALLVTLLAPLASVCVWLVTASKVNTSGVGWALIPVVGDDRRDLGDDRNLQSDL
ncbi:hypothetical protein [Streptomyces hebeiensis]